MTIATLCTGDTVVPQTETSTVGTGGGIEYAYADGTALDCLVQTMDADEAVKYATRGQRNMYTLFFSSDPSLSQGFRLEWTHQGGAAFATAKILRVLDQSTEGRPGTGSPMLWIVDAEESTPRQEI